VTGRDSSGRFTVVRPDPRPSAQWTEPDGLTTETRIWVKSAIDHIVAGLEPLPKLEVDTGLCELPIEVTFEGTTIHHICTRVRGHKGEPCAPLDTQGRNVLEALAEASPEVPHSKHGGE
jgi:hypothetical protein